MDNIEIARQTLRLLMERLKYNIPSTDTAEIEKLMCVGLDALSAVEVEMKLLRDAHRTAMKALMHRLGDPG
jgi:uncharacterized coiled-coil protein SlyX